MGKWVELNIHLFFASPTSYSTSFASNLHFFILKDRVSNSVCAGCKLEMFSSSSSNHINPFAHLPATSCFHPPPTSPFCHDSDDSFLHHHHDLLSGPFVAAANPQINEPLINMALLNNARMTKLDIDSLNGDYFASSSFIPSKKPVKKDRHSKICTAHGLRDRRVRLSIEIAREFFDLQDMLGFDKASKTLEWLLMKSKNAIRELAKMKQLSDGVTKSLSSTSDDECEVLYENDDVEGPLSKTKSRGGISEAKKKKKLRKSLAKETREKARARARERTEEKMRTRRIHDWKKFPDTSPQVLSQVKSPNQLEACKKPADSYRQNMTPCFKVAADDVEELDLHLLAREAPREGIIEQSLVKKRKVKPSSILAYQQDLAGSKDASWGTINDNNYFPDLPQYWDISGAIKHSTFYSITNVNLSTGLPICGAKP